MPLDTPRFGLNGLDFLETSPSVIRDGIIARYQEASGRTLAQGDPLRLVLESVAAYIAQLSKAVQLACRNNLLSYATGDYLDPMGYYVNTPRLEASKASVTLKFTLTAAQDGAFQIPAGTQVSDGAHYFATDELAIIPAGDTSIEVTATATEAGAASNDLAAGTITQLSDPIPGVDSVTNETASTGGADREDDEAYAERIHLAPSSFSVAGPHDAYLYHTLKFSSSIVDAAVYGLTDHPGNVYVHPLLKGGEIPGDAFISQLSAYLSADTIRPLTDNVLVSAPTASEYSIAFTWYLSNDDLDRSDQITAAVALAAEDYRTWQQAKIGRDINPDHLVKLLIEAGAKRVTVTSPEFKALERSEVAQCTGTEITFGGAEDA